MLRALALLALIGGLLVVAGCGSDSDLVGRRRTTATEEESSEEEASTPAQALAEIAIIRTSLDAAVASTSPANTRPPQTRWATSTSIITRRSRGRSETSNHDLMEEIEEKLSTDLRTSMEDGADQSEIDSLVAEIKTGLDQAEEELS